jgi:hypothetical protein
MASCPYRLQRSFLCQRQARLMQRQNEGAARFCCSPHTCTMRALNKFGLGRILKGIPRWRRTYCSLSKFAGRFRHIRWLQMEPGSCSNRRGELVGVDGADHISRVRIREANGTVRQEATPGVFVFIGAKPRTDFLPASIARDDKGFLLTGSDVALLPSWTEPLRRALSKRPFPACSLPVTVEAAQRNELPLPSAMAHWR